MSLAEFRRPDAAGDLHIVWKFFSGPAQSWTKVTNSASTSWPSWPSFSFSSAPPPCGLFAGPARPQAVAESGDNAEMEALKEKATRRLQEDPRGDATGLSVDRRIGHDVGEHNARVKQINEELSGAAVEGSVDLEAAVLAAVSKVTQANEQLQNELRSAEAKLAEQAAALQSQMEMARTERPDRRSQPSGLRRRNPTPSLGVPTLPHSGIAAVVRH